MRDAAASSACWPAAGVIGHSVPVSLRAVLGELVVCVSLCFPTGARAWVVPASAPPTPACPAIPDADDVRLTAEELARVQAGEIVVRVGEMESEGRRVWAFGYLDGDPVWIFDMATDSTLVKDLVDIVESVDVLDLRPHGKTVRNVARVSRWLPRFEYTLVVSYLEDQTGQCWAQISGDLAKNQGSHAYFWDPQRQRTFVALSFEIGLKGMMRVVPQSLVLRLSGRTLPNYMHALERLSARLHKEDPERAERNEQRWRALRARIEANELPQRVWLGAPGLYSAGTRSTDPRLEKSAGK